MLDDLVVLQEDSSGRFMKVKIVICNMICYMDVFDVTVLLHVMSYILCSCSVFMSFKYCSAVSLAGGCTHHVTLNMICPLSTDCLLTLILTLDCALASNVRACVVLPV